MCNQIRKHPGELTTWREYIGWPRPALDFESDVWSKRLALIIRRAEGQKILDAMTWGVPLTVPGRRLATTVKRHVTNLRNLESPFWRAMLVRP